MFLKTYFLIDLKRFAVNFFFVEKVLTKTEIAEKKHEKKTNQ